jgi:Holliday junction resolvasome RuvABC endonuclease subunit
MARASGRGDEIMDDILFIDPGSITTGYAWRESSQIISGVIALKETSAIETRLKLLRSSISGLIEPQESPLFKLAVIEIPVAHDYARNMGRKGKQVTIKSLFILSRAVGVIQECCAARGLKIIEVSATAWTEGFPKKYRCPEASRITDKRITDHNEADAICLLDWWERIGKNGR